MAFNIMPIEVNASIASLLDDRDLCAFSLISPATHASVNCASSSVWRDRFKVSFDLLPRVTNDKLKAIYQFRKMTLRHGAHFRDGQSKKEKECLHVLHDLMVQSFCGQEKAVGDTNSLMSLNLKVVEKFVRDHDILRNVLSRKYLATTDPLLLVLQFDLYVRSPTFGFPDSQRVVYDTITKQPIFKGPNKVDVNVEFVAHAVNFFKYHMTRPEEHTLYYDYAGLPNSDHIQAWDKQLQFGAQKLGKSWRGIYSYVMLGDLAELRESSEDDDIMIMDNFREDSGGGVFQTMDLDFLEGPHYWPQVFERHLHSRTHSSAAHFANPANASPRSNQPRPRTRAQHSHNHPTTSTASGTNQTPIQNIETKPLSFQFIGNGVDTEAFLASGWLTPLPSQHGVPGWMRWTMMKFFLPETEPGQREQTKLSTQEQFAAAAAVAAADGGALWAYEGVVLPGGKVVVGRWWGPTSNDDELEYSGPFMLWSVDEPVAE